MANAMQGYSAWEPISTHGAPGTPIDVKFLDYPMYGGFQETMRGYYPNYPTAFVNMAGLPYTETGQYGGFLAGFIDEKDKG